MGGPGRADGLFAGQTALYVPGSSYMTYPNNASLNPGSGAFSMVAWIKNNAGGNGIIFNKEDQFEIAVQNNNIEWAMSNNSPGWAWISTGFTPTANTWTQVAFTSTGSLVNVYINGVAVQSNYPVAGAISNARQDGLMVGQRGNGGQSFDGAISNVAYFNTALTSSALLTQYQAATTGVGSAANLAFTGANIKLSGNVTTSGTQTYNGAVVFNSNVTIDSTGNSGAGANIAFNGTINNGSAAVRNLTVTAGTGNVNYAGVIGSGVHGPIGNFVTNATGTTTFGASVNAASLTTNAGGTTAINGGSITTTGAQTFNDNVTLGAATTLTASSIATYGTFALNSYSLDLVTSADVNMDGVISGTGGLTKTGAGNLILNALNTYTGATLIGAGTLTVSGGLSDSAAVTINSGASYIVNADDRIASITGAGNVTLNYTLTVGDATNTSFSGVISGVGGLTKVGTGELTLLGANTYTGATNINVGTLTIAGSLSDSTAVTVASGATYNVNASDTVGSIAGGGAITTSTSGAKVLTVGGDGTSTTFSGVLSDGSGLLALTKIGVGSLTLSGTNTFSGVTLLNVGTLIIANDSGLGSTVGGTTVASGAILDLYNVAVGDETITLGGGTL